MIIKSIVSKVKFIMTEKKQLNCQATGTGIGDWDLGLVNGEWDKLHM